MNRRKFLTRLASATALALAAGVTTVTLEGCSINVEDAINIVLSSALAILKVATPGAGWLGALANAIAQVQTAETQWKSGSAAAIVVDALNTLEAVIAVIPITEPFSPLVDILVAAIETAMSTFGLATSLDTAEQMHKRKTVVNSQHYKAASVTPSLVHPTWTGAYKAQWNKKAIQLKLPQAEIK